MTEPQLVLLRDTMAETWFEAGECAFEQGDAGGRRRARRTIYWFMRPRWSCEMHSAIQTMLRISCSLSLTNA